MIGSPVCRKITVLDSQGGRNRVVHFMCELSRDDIVRKLAAKGGWAQRGIVSQFGNLGALRGYITDGATAADRPFYSFLATNPLCLVILLYEVDRCICKLLLIRCLMLNYFVGRLWTVCPGCTSTTSVILTLSRRMSLFT